MAEIERKAQKVFAGGVSPSGNIAVYGSKLAGSVNYSSDIDAIQSENWLTGLFGAISPDKAPYVQDLNAIFYVLSKQLAYIFQAGVPEWNSQTEYFANKSIVRYNKKLYIAISNNTNINPESEGNTSWKNFLSWGDIVGDITQQTDLKNALDGKVDRDLANVTGTLLALGSVSIKQAATGILDLICSNGLKVNGNNIGFPDYTTGVSKGANTNHTANNNVFVAVKVSGQDTSMGEFFVDGVSVMYFQITGANTNTGTIFPIKKGSSYRYSQYGGSVTMTEYQVKL